MQKTIGKEEPSLAHSPTKRLPLEFTCVSCSLRPKKSKPIAREASICNVDILLRRWRCDLAAGRLGKGLTRKFCLALRLAVGFNCLLRADPGVFRDVWPAQAPSG